MLGFSNQKNQRGYGLELDSFADIVALSYVRISVTA